MSPCCGGGGATTAEEREAKKKEKATTAFTKDGENDISKGPAENRGCTDLACCIIMIVAILGYVVVTIWGLKDGNVPRLYKPRDAGGNYCGIKEQWNNAPDLEQHEFQTFTMNVSSTTDIVMKQMVCSKASQDYLQSQIGTSYTYMGTSHAWTRDDWDSYMCSCCAIPCLPCEKAIEMEDPSRDGDAGALTSLTGSRMNDISGLSSSNVGSLFSPSGSNGDMFSTDIMSHITKYLQKVCLKSCTVSYETIQAANGSTSSYAYRDYFYNPIPKSEFSGAWEVLKTDTIGFKAAIDTFKFKALSLEDCPYDPVYCVPFPGISFSEAALNYCMVEMSPEVVGALGSTLTGIMESAALTDFSNGATESLGEQWGAINSSWGAFILTGVCSFVIGIVFLIAVRFLVGICVWASIFLIFVLICCFSGLCYVKSIQCAGATLYQTGRQTGTQLATYAVTTASQAASGETVSEALEGDGNKYRGVQSRSKYGVKCQKWSSQTPQKHDITDANFPGQGLGDHNKCRNPYNETQVNKGKTIWCFTENSALRWEECLPIGLNPPECPNGYAVTGQTARDVLLYSCYTFMGIAGLWLLIVLFFLKSILLAIRVTKVAARFLAQTPTILLIPASQTLFAITWALGWAFGAAFLLSQVPDSYTPTGHWPDYNSAWEKCIYDGGGDFGYPVSEVWRDERCGGANGECWRCYPPRYMIDPRFAYVFFMYLWVNAYTIAAGQCIIAGAVCVWFFKMDEAKHLGGALKKSIWTVTRYHMGSLAFGSFIIAVVQFIRYVMKFIEKQAEARKNRVMVYVARAIQCCLWCFEKSLEFLNKLAYIQIALLGKNFCTSAKTAFYLVLRHMARFAAVLMVGEALDRIGLICIMACTTFVGYIIQTTLYPEVSPLCPTAIYLVMGYVVGKLYMNVFHLCIDSCLQCFIAVEEMGLSEENVPEELKSCVPAKKDKDPDKEADAAPPEKDPPAGDDASI